MHSSSQRNARRYLVLLMLGGVLGLTYLSASGQGSSPVMLLPLLFLLACPILHIFLHRGHSHASASPRAADDHAHVGPE